MKIVLVVGGLFLFLLSVSAGTFVETFDGVDLDKWQEISMFDFKIMPETWEIIDGALQGIYHSSVMTFLTMDGKQWRNYAIKLDVKPLEKHGPGGIGIVARIKESVGLVCTIGDSPIPIPTQGSNAICWVGDFQGNRFEVFGFAANPLLKLETRSTLKLSVKDETFTFWINGKKIMETGDPFIFPFGDQQIGEKAGRLFNLPIGGAGFGLSNYTVLFDNIVITGDGIPNKGRLSVSPQAKLATVWSSLKRF